MALRLPIALVTGGNTGIGLATATQLARDHGYHVIIGSRSAVAGEEVADSLRKQGHQASSVALDLSSDDSISAAVEKLKEKYGKLDVLINNAGILVDYLPGFLEISKDWSPRQRYSKTFDTNVIGAALLTEALLPLLLAAELPRIIFVSSVMGSLTRSLDKTTAWYNIDYKIYDSSKAAMNMIAINFARIIGERGLVNVVCPGLNKTNLTRFAMGHSPDIGAKRIVELAVSTQSTGTFTDIDGVIPW